MEIAIYAFTSTGARLCDVITDGLKEHKVEIFVPEKYAHESKYAKKLTDTIQASTEKSFREKSCIIYIGAAGIAVRSIAPFVKSKITDPAVICIDEKGINVISLLSGHIGGANKLTVQIADIIGGNPIITTATDINNKLSVDEWANSKNMHIADMKKAKDVAADILQNYKINLKSDFEIIGKIPEEIKLWNENENKSLDHLNKTKQSSTIICISLNDNDKPFENTLNLIPKIVSVGVGCRKNARYEDILNAIKDVLSENNISHHGIKSLNSIDLKKEEAGIIKAAKELNVPFNTYTSNELKQVEGNFSNSDFVKSVAGVDSVCERAAVLGSDSKKMVIKKTVKNSVTVAACVDEYKVDFDY